MYGIIRSRLCVCTPRILLSSKLAARKASTGNVSPKFRPTDFHKFILVWTKKFKTKEEIPDFVSHDLIDRAKSEVRIKVANYLMLLTVLASIGFIISGKAAAKRGESVQKMNEEFHRKYREEYEKAHATKTT